MKNIENAAMPISSMVKWRLAARPSGRPAQGRRTASISESSHSPLPWSQLPTSNSIRKPFPDSTCRTKIASLAPPTTRKIKMRIAASKHKAMSYGRMAERATELEAEVAGWLSAAEAADAEEDKLYGRDKTGEELPDWVADKQRRAEKIRQAKAELEAEAKAAAEAELKE